MVELMGLDTNLLGTSNFQNISLFHPDSGFGAVTKFQELSRADLNFLISLQPADGPLGPKMTFLVGDRDTLGAPARPYWTIGGSWGENWRNFRFGTMLFGGQKAKVETDTHGNPVIYNFRARWQGSRTLQNIEFYKVIGMRKHEMNLRHSTHPWLVQRCTWATWPGNEYRDTWHSGVVYHPVWSPLDWPHNYGNELFLAKLFCK